MADDIAANVGDTRAEDPRREFRFFRDIRNEVQESLSQEKDLKKLEVEAQRVELRLREMEASARVAQEMAIAKRIESAEIVEIEEFYDTNGSANVGLTADKVTTFGASASGSFVKKRVIRFRNRDTGVDAET